ncbi:MAG: hypothetical protein Q7R95_01595 [bacterium]|nr:hypothetical protein [bacterium]
MNNWTPFIIFCFEILILYYFTHITLQKIFQVFHSFFHHNSFVNALISLVLLPGTIVHEMAHFIMASILLLKVDHIEIFPKWNDKEIKLGSVQYHKKDIIRGFFVGIAPLFLGFIILRILLMYIPFPNSNSLNDILFCYILFIITLTMFSSYTDLQDAIYAIPLMVILYCIYVLYGSQFILSFNSNAVLHYINSSIIQPLNFVLLIAIIIHICFSMIINIFTIKII